MRSVRFLYLGLGAVLGLSADCTAYEARLLHASTKPSHATSDAGHAEGGLDARPVPGTPDAASSDGGFVIAAHDAAGCEPAPSDSGCSEICPETCNGQDDDCDGRVDEQVADDVCAADHAQTVCARGACRIVRCLDGNIDCDGDARTGCEVPPDDPQNCGLCGHACTIGSCAGGVCTVATCSDPFADCNGDGIDCEANLSNDIGHCGACGVQCSFDVAVPRATTSCVDRRCELSCASGYGDCDSDFGNGCEAQTADTDGDGVDDCRDGCPLDASHTTGPCNLPANIDTSDMSFAAASRWNCTSAGTTTIDSTSGTVTSTSCALGALDVVNDVAQLDANGPQVMVVKVGALTITNGHVLHLTGDKPVVFLVGGDVVVDNGGRIDADATGVTPGAGGSSASQCGASAGGAGSSARNGKSGGGGGFGTKGGAGGGNTSSAGAVSADTDLQPLRGGCAGGAASSAGGAGGGAFQITASGAISIGHVGDTATTTGVLSAAGGGSPGTHAGSDVPSGGGGSGGGILLQSAGAIAFGSNGAARAHGGGSGGASDTTTAGQDGHATDDKAAAGGTSSDGAGARGASGGLCAGADCSKASVIGANGGSGAGGANSGGGGGGGRIRID